jgi:drug/metabolite transporter (DMT)-like permease
MCITNSYVKGKGGKLKKNLTDSPVLFCRSVRLLTRLSTAFFFCVYLFVFHALLQDIADANILNKLSPFFAILISIFILKEKPNKVEWLSVLMAFIGAAFVAKPGAGHLRL